MSFKLFSKLSSFLIILCTLVSAFNPSSVLAFEYIPTETRDLTIVEQINCYNKNSKALNNLNPVIGTKVMCDFSTPSRDDNFNSLLKSGMRVRIGSAPQSPLCSKSEGDYSSVFSCENIPVSGRAGWQTVKVNNKIVGKIKVEASTPVLSIEKIYHLDDKKDPTDPNHQYVIEVRSKNFKTGENGYKIIVYPKDMKNPIKSKITLENHEDGNIYIAPNTYTRSQLANSTNEVCVVVARYNKILPKTKSCQPLPPNEPNKQITSELISKSLTCPESVNISNGENSFKCDLNLPNGSVFNDDNYTNSTNRITVTKSYKEATMNDARFSILSAPEDQIGKYLGEYIGKCKLSDKVLSCTLDLEAIKKLNIPLPNQSVIKVMAIKPYSDNPDEEFPVKQITVK